MPPFANDFSRNNFIGFGLFNLSFKSIDRQLSPFDLVQRFHTGNDSAKDGVFTVERIVVLQIQKELASAGIAACISHRNRAGKIPPSVSCFALTFDLVARTSGPDAFGFITAALSHKVFDHTMEQLVGVVS